MIRVKSHRRRNGSIARSHIRDRAGVKFASETEKRKYFLYSSGERFHEFWINHANIHMYPHEILKEHGIPVKEWDYTVKVARTIRVSKSDEQDALKALRSYIVLS
jgi:hypothetical protein